jgi:hypothetical protein
MLLTLLSIEHGPVCRTRGPFRSCLGDRPPQRRLKPDQGHELRSAVRIHDTIREFQRDNTPGSRSRSWEHCYGYFRNVGRQGIAANRDHAALHLGFYLASWGMYRGSGFLLEHDYTVHLPVIDQLLAPRFALLWEREFGASDNDRDLMRVILEAIEAIREAYRPLAKARLATPLLVTKIILGSFGCLPAVDEFFLWGFRDASFQYSDLNGKFIELVLNFCRENLNDFRREQTWIERDRPVRYPLMKLVDMHFHQSGYELDRKAKENRLSPGPSQTSSRAKGK